MSSAAGEVALLSAIPRLAGGVPWVRLGDWPTPIDTIPGLDLYVKRDDVSGARYGGNKVRTLEALFGEARASGAEQIWATGAFGSNHALATVLHAHAAGLTPAVMLFPQPPSACARENLAATLSARPGVRALVSWATLPLAIARERWRGRTSYVMVPGGATPIGALGYVSAALEVGGQVAAGVAPAPARIVLGVGSTCTSAGLLAGVAIAARLGVGFGVRGAPVPEIWSIRVTPWPVTSAWRIVSLAGRTAALVARLAGDPSLAIPRRELAARLRVFGGHIGRGYGHVTDEGVEAIRRFEQHGGPPLDTCYSGKAAAGLLAREGARPVLFWATKSSRPLPPPDAEALAAAPPAMRRWLTV